MSETASPPGPRDAESGRQMWRFALDPYAPRRRPTREVRVGDIGIGGSNPIRVQSMTIADTLDTGAVVDEIEALHAAGGEIVRVTAPNRTSAENLGAIRQALRKRRVRVPLVADIHFTPQAALIAALHVEKVRINPGNYADRKHFKKWEYSDAEYAEELERLEASFRPLVLRCKERGVAMRIGTNHGSLSDRILNRYGDTPLGMVESALEFVHICEYHGYRDLVLSMKASDVKIMIAAYRLLAARMRDEGMDYPFHLGVTEAGAGTGARVKSAIGIGALLTDGIGDTVRVSLTEDSVHEIPLAQALAALAPSSGAPRTEHLAADRPPVPAWDPYVFERRHVLEMGSAAARLAREAPPRIESLVSVPRRTCESAECALAFVGAACDREAGLEGADLLLLRFDCTFEKQTEILPRLHDWARQRGADRRPAIGLELPVEVLVRSERARLAVFDRLSLRAADLIGYPNLDLARLPALQYTLGAADFDLGRDVARRVETGAWPIGALAVELPNPTSAPAPHVLRRFLGAVESFRPMPIVWRVAPEGAEPIDAHLTRSELGLVVTCGSLLADGRGDALQIETEVSAAGRALAREILQATRLRLTRADFIACPSCGRTQFDLQTTTARIEARFRHLEGLKIAVMGCIVNGPGEMADADFGYVGSGPGQIDLYVGKERVERNVPESEAASRLEGLIRSRGRWQEPATELAEPPRVQT